MSGSDARRVVFRDHGLEYRMAAQSASGERQDIDPRRRSDRSLARGQRSKLLRRLAAAEVLRRRECQPAAGEPDPHGSRRSLGRSHPAGPVLGPSSWMALPPLYGGGLYDDFRCLAERLRVIFTEMFRGGDEMQKSNPVMNRDRTQVSTVIVMSKLGREGGAHPQRNDHVSDR